ncbi:DDB1- and CUL4-associated factor 5 isoform X1 [Anguilla rostrata]|uniref:DDB1- and CUL4-associated factor 5 isoform X1 n=1 Tax=Anguilla rostrata TaxID=7938 RepID=UPI0030D36FD4
MEKAIHSRAKPLKLKGEHLSNIFCLAFDSTNKRVFSGGNDEQVILHDVERGETLNVFLHDDAVYGLSVSPVNDNVFASSSDDGRVLIWDTREPPHGEPFCLANYPSAFHSVMFNPAEPRLLATANSKEGVGLWDIRKPRSSLLRYGGSLSLQSAMSVRFNSTGTQLLALRRRLPPVLYELHSRLPIFQFDNQGYFNSCTMKSCCFAGDRDQYILSGSDDFNLYMWRIPKDPEAGGPGRVVNGAFMVLKGHRSIVNQVRFNPHTYMICSSGVEKVIKVWSPYQQPESMGDLEGRVEDKSRSLYTHEEYISLVLNSGSGLSHDYVSQSIQEDPRMMAFFDSLVRREIEGWSSDSDSDLSEGAILQLHARGRRALRAGAGRGGGAWPPMPPPPQPPQPWPPPQPSAATATRTTPPLPRWRVRTGRRPCWTRGRGSRAGGAWWASPTSRCGCWTWPTTRRTPAASGPTPCSAPAPPAPGATPACPAAAPPPPAPAPPPPPAPAPAATGRTRSGAGPTPAAATPPAGAACASPTSRGTGPSPPRPSTPAWTPAATPRSPSRTPPPRLPPPPPPPRWTRRRRFRATFESGEAPRETGTDGRAPRPPPDPAPPPLPSARRGRRAGQRRRDFRADPRLFRRTGWVRGPSRGAGPGTVAGRGPRKAPPKVRVRRRATARSPPTGAGAFWDSRAPS